MSNKNENMTVLPQLTQLDFNDFGTTDIPWYHPGVTQLKDGTWLATIQRINGSDFYGNPYFTFSRDEGKNWTMPEEIKGFKAHPFKNLDFQVAVADIRPFTSPNDGTVFVFGCTVLYSPTGNVYGQREQIPDFPQEDSQYVTYSRKNGWSESHALPLPEYRGAYRAACTQICFLPDNEVLIPIYLERGKTQWGGMPSDKYAVVVARYRQVGEELEYLSMSPYIEGGTQRGMIEPSIIPLAEGGYALTIRAEDDHGYVCCSRDGTHWSERIPWHWNDEAETPLKMSSTQQHWIRLGSRVYLVYTRDDGTNSSVFRYRAPLFLAEALPAQGILKQETELVAIPRMSIGGGDALYGNFHCTQLDARTALITDAGQNSCRSRVMATRVSL